MKFALIAVLLCGGVASAQPAPVTDLMAADHPWDNAKKVDLTWVLSPDDPDNISAYLVFKGVARVGGVDVEPVFKPADSVPPGSTSCTVTDLTPELHHWQVVQQYDTIPAVAEMLKTTHGQVAIGYVFQVIAVGTEGGHSAPAQTTTPIFPSRQPFDGSRFWFMITLGIFCGAVIMFIRLARGGRPLKVRKIAGLEAVDEAVGRATEMGRSVLFVPGLQDMNDIQTIAGINILARVARTAAAYDARLEVPTCRSLVMTTARETVHGAFLEAGRPEAYNEDIIYYVTDEQFGYVAYLQGMMVREKPAACFYMGSFFAESLILAETGNNIGAIQVAGTAQPAQLPFFVAACDYTLIGEEFFAASAYLTGTPEELGSLKGQDVGKLIVAAGIVGGVFALTLGTILGSGTSFGALLLAAVNFFKGVMLT